jgi:hypothetical protein
MRVPLHRKRQHVPRQHHTHWLPSVDNRFDSSPGVATTGAPKACKVAPGSMRKS